MHGRGGDVFVAAVVDVDAAEAVGREAGEDVREAVVVICYCGRISLLVRTYMDGYFLGLHTMKFARIGCACCVAAANQGTLPLSTSSSVSTVSSSLV